MKKTVQAKAKGKITQAAQDVAQEITSLATEAFDAEIKRKDFDAKARQQKKVVDGNVKQINALYNKNGLTEITHFSRKRGDTSYDIKVGELPSSSTTTVLYEKLFADFKAGQLSDAEMLKVFSKLSKGAVDELGDVVAASYLKTNTGNTKFALKVK